jgi:hypothetical protein
LVVLGMRYQWRRGFYGDEAGATLTARNDSGGAKQCVFPRWRR